MGDNIAAQSGSQLSNFAQSRNAEAARPQRGESITSELNNNHSTKPTISAAAEEIPAVTEGRSSEADKFLASSAAFHDVSVDLLSSGLVPSALLAQEGQRSLGSVAVDSDGASHRNFSAPVLAAVGSTPGGINIPSPGGPATTVFEAGLGPRNGEPPGTHAGQSSFPTTTKPGTISSCCRPVE
jgi:hypothetical protein